MTAIVVCNSVHNFMKSLISNRCIDCRWKTGLSYPVDGECLCAICSGGIVGSGIGYLKRKGGRCLATIGHSEFDAVVGEWSEWIVGYAVTIVVSGECEYGIWTADGQRLCGRGASLIAKGNGERSRVCASYIKIKIIDVSVAIGIGIRRAIKIVRIRHPSHSGRDIEVVHGAGCLCAGETNNRVGLGSAHASGIAYLYGECAGACWGVRRIGIGAIGDPSYGAVDD